MTPCPPEEMSEDKNACHDTLCSGIAQVSRVDLGESEGGEKRKGGQIEERG
jgi:hypothetical protein